MNLFPCQIVLICHSCWMRSLTLMRHAKSNWSDPSLEDFDRPLNSRGQGDAPRMGRRLQNQRFRVDRMVSSPANRAHTTAKLLAKEIDYPSEEIILEPSIYEASSKTLIQVIRSFPDASKRILMIGHNPGFTDTVTRLTGNPFENLPTCGIVHLSFRPASWAQAENNCCDLVFFDYPKRTPGS